METPFYLSIPSAKTIMVCGDIHGEFNLLVYKLCIQYKMRDTLLIVAGDCGFGFEKPEYYKSIVKKNSARMSKANNWIVFVRGNHDNPAYFDGKSFAYKRFIAVPDYAVIQASGRTILGVGGGISIDRMRLCLNLSGRNFPLMLLLPILHLHSVNLHQKVWWLILRRRIPNCWGMCKRRGR